MPQGKRCARLIVTAILAVPLFADFGCQKMFRVLFDGNERGGRIAIDGPDFRMNAEGGPNGGRLDLDAPGASIHASGRATPRYGRYLSYRRPFGDQPYRRPWAPGSSGAPRSPADSTVPADYAASLVPDAAEADPGAYELGGNSPKAPEAPSVRSPAVDRFADLQPAPAERNLRAKVDPIGVEEAASELAMLGLINQIRGKHEEGPVASDKTLDVVARRHSEEMEALNYFDHTSPVEQNRTLRDRLHNDGVQFRHAAENIAKFPYRLGSNVVVAGSDGRTPQTPVELAEDMMEGYMNSPGHRANILDPQVSRIGLGTVIGKTYAYNTQNFRD